MTPTGVRELPYYLDNRDLAADWFAGVVKAFEEIIYRDLICEVIGDFVDDDGDKYTELMPTELTGVSFIQMM